MRLRLLALMSVAALVLLLAGCPKTPAVLRVSIDQADQELQVGASTALTATVHVVGGAREAVSWSSSHDAVAQVDSGGVVVAIAEGTAVITATSVDDDEKFDSVTITVGAASVEPDDPADAKPTETQEVAVEVTGATIVLATGNAVFVSEDVVTGADLLISTYDELPADLRDEADVSGPVVRLRLPLSSLVTPIPVSPGSEAPASNDEYFDYGLGIKVVRSLGEPEPDVVFISIRLRDGGHFQMIRPFLSVDGEAAYVAVAPSILADLSTLGILSDDVDIVVAPARFPHQAAASVAPVGTLATAQTGLYSIGREFVEGRAYAAVCPNAYDQLDSRSSAVQRLTSAVPATGRTPLVMVHGWQTLGNNVAALINYSERLAEFGEIEIPISLKASDWLKTLAELYQAIDAAITVRFAPHVCAWGHFIDHFYASGMDEVYDLYSFAYDSDLSIQGNAASLAAALTDHISGTPSDPGRASILAHSMGGLVANAAARHLASDASIELEDVITYGTPYKGSSLLTCHDAQCETAGAHPNVYLEVDRLLLRLAASAETSEERDQLLLIGDVVRALIGRLEHLLVKHPGTRDLAWDAPLAYRVPTGCPATIAPADAPTPWCFASASTFANPWLASLNAASDATLAPFQAIVGDIGSVRSGDMLYDVLQEVVFYSILDELTDGIVPLRSADLEGRVDTMAVFLGGDHSLIGGGDVGFAADCTLTQGDARSERRCSLMRAIETVLLQQAAASLEYVPSSLVATVPADGLATQVLEIQNVGAGPAVIEAITSTESWLSADPIQAMIPGGSSVLVTVEWNAAGMSLGSYATTLDVQWRSVAGDEGTVTDTLPVMAAITSGLDQFRLFGSVRDTSNAPLAGVLIAVEVDGVPFAATTDLGGHYDFSFYRADLAAASVRFAKAGFASHVVPITFDGSQLELHVTLEPLFEGNVLFSDGFETCEVAWQVDNYDDGMWNCRDNTIIRNRAFVDGYVTLVAGDGSGGYVPTPFAGQRSFWYGDPVTGNFIGEQSSGDAPLSGGRSTKANGGRLISRASVDLSGVSAARLEGITWYEVESVDIAQGQFDQMLVELWEGHPLSGGTRRVAQRLNPPFEPPLQSPSIPYTSGGNERPALWVPFAVDLAPVVGGSDIFIVFDFRTVDNLYNGFRGWLLDEVQVIAGAASMASSSSTPISPEPVFWEPSRR